MTSTCDFHLFDFHLLDKSSIDLTWFLKLSSIWSNHVEHSKGLAQLYTLPPFTHLYEGVTLYYTKDVISYYAKDGTLYYAEDGTSYYAEVGTSYYAGHYLVP